MVCLADPHELVCRQALAPLASLLQKVIFSNFEVRNCVLCAVARTWTGLCTQQKAQLLEAANCHDAS